MVDYQYQPDMDDPIAKLRSAMDNMDGEHPEHVSCAMPIKGTLVDGILNYHIPEEKEDYVIPEDPDAMEIDPQLLGTDEPTGPKMKSNLRLFTPPLFGRQPIPQNYKWACFLPDATSS